ncbi:MAG: DUF2079 domain-containing protein [Candidatus Omnitrophica bacterium]|nr:DUF2079 domain-containing protein [Candidatus Omnitrophota bacterium]
MPLKVFDFMLNIYFFLYLGLFLTDYHIISNISGPTMGLIALLVFRYYSHKESFFEIGFISNIKKIVDSKDNTLIFSFMAILVFVFSGVSIARHFALSSGSQDLGIFDQAIWNTTQGRWLFSSLKGNMSLLGDHFEPILLFVAPLYLAWNSPLVLLILQALLLASAVIPLFLILKHIVKDRAPIIAFIVSYMLSKPLRGVAYSDFHPECFMVPLLFWCCYFVIIKKDGLFCGSLFLLAFCKEDAVLYVVAFGLFIFIIQRRYLLGLSLCVMGIALWIMETKLFIPFFNPKCVYTYVDRLPFGPSYTANIKGVIYEPMRFLSIIFTPQKLEYCLKMFGPLGFMSFLSPAHYILIALPLLRNLLPQDINFSGYYNITSHYTAGLIPFIFVSAIYGSNLIIRRLKVKNIALHLSLFIIFSSLFFFSKTDGYKLSRFISTIKKEGTLRKLSHLKGIPQNASVAANFNLVPHLAHRKYIFEWNPAAKSMSIAEYIVIDKDLLGYIVKADLPKVESFLENCANQGYRVAFMSHDGRFVILHNPTIDKTLVEGAF